MNETPAPPPIFAQPVVAILVLAMENRAGQRRLHFEPVTMLPGDGGIEPVPLEDDETFVALVPTPGLTCLYSEGLVEHGETVGDGELWYEWTTQRPVADHPIAAPSALERLRWATARRAAKAAT